MLGYGWLGSILGLDFKCFIDDCAHGFCLDSVNGHALRSLTSVKLILDILEAR